MMQGSEFLMRGPDKKKIEERMGIPIGSLVFLVEGSGKLMEPAGYFYMRNPDREFDADNKIQRVQI